MAVHLLKKKATRAQIEDMLTALETYIKLAVDLDRGVLAGGGELHADCEAVLIADGSRQEQVWGANWYPSKKMVSYEAMLNIAPRRHNPSMEIQDPRICKAVDAIARRLLDVRD